MIMELELREWKQMAAEVEACLRTDGSRMSCLGVRLIKEFGLEMTKAVPRLIGELEKLQDELEELQKKEKNGL